MYGSRKLDLSRQADMFPDISHLSFLFAGVGGAGSNAAHLVASLGIERGDLVDFDAIEEANLSPGFFSAGTRVKSLSTMRAINTVLGGNSTGYWRTSQTLFEESGDFFRDEYDVIVCCPDNIAARRWLWEEMRSRCEHFIDLSMGGTVCQAYYVNMGNEEHIDKFSRSFEAITSEVLPCGMKATASLTKGFLPGMLGKILYDLANERVPPYYQTYSLESGLYISAK